jgi:hypothetical protein
MRQESCPRRKFGPRFTATILCHDS